MTSETKNLLQRIKEIYELLSNDITRQRIVRNLFNNNDLSNTQAKSLENIVAQFNHRHKDDMFYLMQNFKIYNKIFPNYDILDNLFKTPDKYFDIMISTKDELHKKYLKHCEKTNSLNHILIDKVNTEYLQEMFSDNGIFENNPNFVKDIIIQTTNHIKKELHPPIPTGDMKIFYERLFQFAELYKQGKAVQIDINPDKIYEVDNSPLFENKPIPVYQVFNTPYSIRAIAEHIIKCSKNYSKIYTNYIDMYRKFFYLNQEQTLLIRLINDDFLYNLHNNYETVKALEGVDFDHLLKP